MRHQLTEKNIKNNNLIFYFSKEIFFVGKRETQIGHVTFVMLIITINNYL